MDERDPRRRVWRDSTVDGYCVLQLLILLGIFLRSERPVLNSVLGWYIIFEIYLNLLSILFLPPQREIGPPTPADEPSAVNEPSTSPERSILLLFINVVQLVLAYAVFYRGVLHVPRSSAFLYAVLVFGTVGHPPLSETPPWLVASQVCLDFILVAAVLGSFVGQAGPFARRGRNK